MPPNLLDRVKFAVTLDDLKADVAQLLQPDLVMARVDDTPSDPHSITFTSRTMTSMVLLSSVAAGRVRLDGWAAPGGGLDVELRVGETIHHTVADEDGRFVFEDVPRGLAQFVFRPRSDGGSENRVITPVVEL